jgi:hypothetical protein
LREEVGHWSLTTLWEKLVKISAKVVSHGWYVTFQLSEVAVSRDLFQKCSTSLVGCDRPLYRHNGGPSKCIRASDRTGVCRDSPSASSR